MALLENLSIGLKMEIEDRDQLQIISRDLVPSIKGAMSVNVFNYNKMALAYLLVLTEEDDRSGHTGILLKAFEKYGYSSYGDRICKNGLNYYLTCINPQEDENKDILVKNIKESYDRAVFFAPIEPELSGSIDFKALTLDGTELGSEIFASKRYTVINI